MRLLSIDFDPVYGDGSTRTTFASDMSVFDYDVVIWDPATSLHPYRGYAQTSFKGLPSLSGDESVRLSGDVARRKKEFKDFVEGGKSLVAIVRPPQRCFVDTGERTYSGTGRNRQTTHLMAPIDLWEALPVADPQFVTARGDRIELIGDGSLIALLRKYSERITYRATMSAPPGAVVARVAGTERAVASILRAKSGGVIIMLPYVDLEAEDGEEDDDEESAWADEAPEFQQDLLEAVAALSGGREVTRPAWMANYTTPEQQTIQGEIVQLRKQVERARQALTERQQALEVAERNDQLFLGSGRSLELEVKAVLELLGGVVSEPEPGRDDWQVTFPEQPAVVEVKGVGKSAAEKHAAQLEKWVSGAYEATGTMPKGILVVNTWRDTPLAKRTEKDFPDQMLPYCESRGHCLVTGLDLFLIRKEIEQSPAKAETWRQKLLSTSGRLDGVPNWTQFIDLSAEAEAEGGPA